MDAGKGKEEEQECAGKLATHCYEMITDRIARFAKKRKASSFGQCCFGLAGEDEASSHVVLLHGLVHIESNGQQRGETIAATLYERKEGSKQQEVRRSRNDREVVDEEKEVRICNLLAS